MAAARMAKALEVGQAALPKIPSGLAGEFGESLRELGEFRRRALAYAYHLRETNLVTLLRAARGRAEAYPHRLVDELRGLLLADQANQGQPEPVGAALRMLDEDIHAFLDTYFLVEENKISKGYFSLTSR
jgi:hypothetical protein